MPVHVAALCVILTALVVAPARANCTKGWFGEDCMFKCHCAYFMYCVNNGSCPFNSSCEPGYFGPGCQYVDLANTSRLVANDLYLSDNDETTCNPESNETSVILTFTKAFPFSWFRIHLRETRVLKFSVTLNDQSPCNNMRMYPLTNTTVDITCDVEAIVGSIHIEGELVHSICSVYVSGGRNAALKQTVNQSRSNTTLVHRGTPSHAVDGIILIDSSKMVCAWIGDGSEPPKWYLKFNRPHILHRVIIYTNTVNQQELQGFILETFSVNNTKTNYYKDQSVDPLLIYEAYLTSSAPSILLKIVGASSGVKTITLCEVEVYAENACEDKMYGLACSETCSCEEDQICNVVTGKCAYGCGVRAYGFNCSYKCSEHCMGRFCRQRFGSCLFCRKGYTGDYCSRECDLGTYGEFCSHKCPANCAKPCDVLIGTCPCTENFTGLFCSECKKDHFGTNCSNQCSSNCENSLCNTTTGDCLSCGVGRQGLACEVCPVSYHGLKCKSRCPLTCFNYCDKVTGLCKPCERSDKRVECQKFSEDQSPTQYLVLLVPILPFLVLCLCVVCRHKHTPAKKSVDEGDQASVADCNDEVNDDDNDSINTDTV